MAPVASFSLRDYIDVSYIAYNVVKINSTYLYHFQADQLTEEQIAGMYSLHL